jgi:hypothetical protein
MTDQNSRLNYIKTPIELVACPFFTLKEKEVVAEIISLSDKYLTNGGCCRTNKSLAFRHRITPEKVSNIITTANRLGFVIDREDIVHIKKSSVGKSTRYSTERKLIMRIPEEWVIMGDLYNGAFIREDEELYELFLEIETELKSIKRTELDQEIVSEIIKSRFTRGKSKNLEGLNKNPQANNKSKVLNKSKKRLKDISPDSEINSSDDQKENPPEKKTYSSLSEDLKEIVASVNKITLGTRTNSWPGHFKKMVEVDRTPVPRIRQVLRWYADHIGEEFVPECFSAESFRKKFNNLESAMTRQEPKTRSRTSPGNGTKVKPKKYAGTETEEVETDKDGNLIYSKTGLPFSL